MKRRTFLLCVGVLANSAVYESARAAVPLAPTFSIQGQLENFDASSVEVKFVLWDAATFGNQKGETIPSSVEVDHGLFTAIVDFSNVPGANEFNGDARWIEVWTNRSGTLQPEDMPRIPILATPYALQTRGLYVDDQRNVGMGTTNPQAKLDVIGNVAVRHSLTIGYAQYCPEPPIPYATLKLLFGRDGPEEFAPYIAGNPCRKSLDFYTGNAQHMIIAQNGNVGIGTAAPTKLLNIGDVSVPDSEGMIRLESRSGTDSANRTWEIGVPETEILTLGKGYSFVIDDTQLGTDPEFMVKFGTGNVGIGTTLPAAKLHVVGGHNLRLSNSTGTKIIDLRTDGGDVDVESTTHDLYLKSSGPSGNNRVIINPFGNNGNVGIGTESPAAKLDVNGTARVKILEIMGADVAEKFPVSEPVEPGMVVEIDPEHAGQLRSSREAYNRRVAGVVSGAGDLPTGIVLAHLPGQESAPAIAMSGRVWVHCDTSNGAIEPGHMLTTSDTPGHAMKVTDYARSQGAIIGKAMTSLENGGTGLVLVLVSLQ